MGQAKLRGNRDQRVADARAAAERAEREREEMIAKRWREMTPEQREARLNKAKGEARLYGSLVGTLGHDTAMALSGLYASSRR